MYVGKEERLWGFIGKEKEDLVGEGKVRCLPQVLVSPHLLNGISFTKHYFPFLNLFLPFFILHLNV